MKKNLLSLLAVAAIAVMSCQSEKEYFGSETTTPGEVVEIQLSPVLPTGIKPLASGGGAATLDDTQYALRYILEVYDGGVKVGDRQIKVADNFTTGVSFAVSLPAKSYQFVFWADFTDISSPENDLTYKTDNAGGLKDIEWKESTYKISDNLRDAYTAVEEFDLTLPVNESVTLQRPFGKLRILATDLQDAIDNTGVATPSKAVLTYTHDAGSPVFRKSFNALTGLPNAATIAAGGELECVPEFVDNVTVAGQAFSDVWLLAFDYFLVPNDLSAVSFDIELFDGLTSIVAKSISNAPVDVNKLTTVIGGIFTINSANLDVLIEDAFDDETTPGVVMTLSDETIPATAEGDDYTLTITSTIAWTATVNSEATWCTLSASSGDGSPATVTVSVPEYLGAAPRTATVTFQAGATKKEVTVTQAAYATPAYAASTQTWTFGASPLVWSDYIATGAGGTQVVPIYSDDPLSLTDPQYTARTVSEDTWYYYNWAYVNTNKTTICPSPWRVPDRTDFQALMAAAVSHTNLNAAWAGHGWRYAYSWANDGYNFLWVDEAVDETNATYFYSQSWGFGLSGTGKQASTPIRCVR
jgi:hypothetical protein